MKYHLAKKLKDAGFKTDCMGDEYCPGFHRGIGTLKYEHVCVPTLEELIEACMPLGFYYLRWTTKYDNSPQDHWTACTHGNDKGFGDTPEEAVANLWLALNLKKD